MTRSLAVLVCSSFIIGCKAPPEAPSELNELAGFLFERFQDEDTADLELGITNLQAWLQDNIDSDEKDNVRDGYSVLELDEGVLESVEPDREHNLDGLAGASVAVDSGFGVVPIGTALSVEEQETVFPDNYDSHNRTFDTDPDCFRDQSCDFLDTTNEVEASYTLGLKIATRSRAQYRWLTVGEEGNEMTVLLHRTWLMDKAEIRPPWDVIKVNEQIYVGITMPWDAGSVRLGTTWIAADIGSADVPDALALDAMINAMKTEGENLDVYLSGGSED
ncbi:MAG: hypothetical protein KTR31_05340 [Myxococcales bacterium]|nr:hypothetical protein [Myxococcales bacterium]